MREDATALTIRSAIDESSSPPFLQGWWLRIATRRQPLRTIKIRLPDGRIAAQFTFARRNHFGVRVHGRPSKWTDMCAPVLSQHITAAEKKWALDKLMGELPRRITISVECDPDAPDLPLIRAALLQAGFKENFGHTYVQRPEMLGIFRYLPAPGETDDLGLAASARTPAGTKHNVLSESERATKRNDSRRRNAISGAHRNLDLATSDHRPGTQPITAEQFCRTYLDHLAARGRRPWDSPQDLRELVVEGVARGQIRIIAAQRKPVRGAADPPVIEAAIASVETGTRVYLWRMTRKPDTPAGAGEPRDKAHAGAMKLVLAAWIRDAQRRGLTADVGGTMGHSKNEIIYEQMRMTRVSRPNYIRRSWTGSAAELARPAAKHIRDHYLPRLRATLRPSS